MAVPCVGVLMSVWTLFLRMQCITLTQHVKSREQKQNTPPKRGAWEVAQGILLPGRFHDPARAGIKPLGVHRKRCRLQLV